MSSLYKSLTIIYNSLLKLNTRILPSWNNVVFHPLKKRLLLQESIIPYPIKTFCITVQSLTAGDLTWSMKRPPKCLLWHVLEWSDAHKNKYSNCHKFIPTRFLSPFNNVEGGYRNSHRPSVRPKRKSSHSHNFSPIITKFLQHVYINEKIFNTKKSATNCCHGNRFSF